MEVSQLEIGVRAWLEWHELLGVDAAVAAPGASSGEASGETAPVPDQPAVTSAHAPARSANAAGTTAAVVARGCASVDALRAALEHFEGCALRATATRLCFADGEPTAPLMLVGEAPGAEEDRQGKPFVGPSGQLLDRMLASIGLDRRHAWITNVIYWRPPGNRPPTAQEIATCLPFLHRQIELVAPRLIVSVGGIAARALFGVDEGVTRLRGRRFTYQPPNGGRAIPALVIFHPAYLLRQPAQKKLAWRDLLAIRAALREAGALPDPLPAAGAA